MCQINTDPMRHRSGYFEVVGKLLKKVQKSFEHQKKIYYIVYSTLESPSFFSVPPKIISKDDNPNLVVREGENMTLSCNASGHPKPHIVWRRENGDDIMLSNGKKGTYLLINSA